MKKIQYLFVTIALGLVLTSCGDSFFNQQPEGGTLTAEQYAILPDNLTGSIMGIYSRLYAYGGEHDEFGKRAIDMYGDIQSGDMAMPNDNYGWFVQYDRGYFYSQARSYMWSFYYEIINLTNLCAVAVEDNVQAMLDGIITGDPTDATIEQAYYYGQVLALRGWCYANLLDFYTNPKDEITDLDASLAIPLYTETDMKVAELKGKPRATVAEVYNVIYEDLSQSVTLLDFYGQLHDRKSKLEIDADVARLILAYAMLNHGHSEITIADGKNAYDIAYEQAVAVIDGGKYPLLPKAELTTTGFADLNAGDWMWGQDVTVETTTALASFFGHVDIHTYSYAAAGDFKQIDSKLYDEVVATKWDARKNWFRASGTYKYCPDGKFYSPKYKSITDLEKVDRDWLCDNLFMRVSVAYLIAAEAAYRKSDEVNAVKYLKMLCDERVIDGKETDYNTWLGTLSGDALKEAIIYNWRVEMWGEGYGLQTLRRLSKTVTLGTNHQDARASKAVNADDRCQCEIPTTETRYNPYISNKELQQDND